MSLDDVLTMIRERPGIILGQKSVDILDAFLTGFSYASDDPKDRHFLTGFTQWVRAGSRGPVRLRQDDAAANHRGAGQADVRDRLARRQGCACHPPLATQHRPALPASGPVAGTNGLAQPDLALGAAAGRTMAHP